MKKETFDTGSVRLGNIGTPAQIRDTETKASTKETQTDDSGVVRLGNVGTPAQLR